MRMLKVAGILMCLVIGGAQSRANLCQPWSAENTGAYLYDSAGNSLAGNNLLLIEMVVDMGSYTDYSSLMSGWLGLSGDATGWWVDPSASNDVIIGYTYWQDAGAGGPPYLSYFPGTTSSTTNDTWGSRPFYFRWFNATSEVSATEAGIIYHASTGWVTQAGSSPPPAPPSGITLDYTGCAGTGSQKTGTGGSDGWASMAPVPEPTTLALFGLGLVTIFIRRRFRK